ncbi:hypothetical protein AAFW58_002265 [Salmonella enterica]
MQKKKLISIAIALTLQSYYIPAIAAENNDDEKECPSNISSLPKEKRAKLSPTCLATPENDNHWGWVAGGVAALVAGVAIGVENNGGGDSNHSYTPPLRPIMAATLPHPTMAATSPRLTMAAMTM